jgi:hypothetical protein
VTDPSGQPALQFLSKIVANYLLIQTSGFINPSDVTKNPMIVDQGLFFTHGKYIVVRSKWAQSVDLKTTHTTWLYHIQGTMGIFFDFLLEVLQLYLPQLIVCFFENELQMYLII